MALTKIGTGGIEDDAVTSGKIPANAVGSSEIADTSVTLAKLEHGTSSNDGKFLRANNGADPTFETVSIPAGTTINSNANNRLITGSDTSGELNGESKLTFDGSNDLTLDATVTVDRVINATSGSDPWLKGVDSGNTETSFIKPSGQAFFAGNVGVATGSPVAQTLAGGTAITPILDLKGTGENNTSGVLQLTRKDHALSLIHI